MNQNINKQYESAFNTITNFKFHDQIENFHNQIEKDIFGYFSKYPFSSSLLNRYLNDNEFRKNTSIENKNNQLQIYRSIANDSEATFKDSYELENINLVKSQRSKRESSYKVNFYHKLFGHNNQQSHNKKQPYEQIGANNYMKPSYESISNLMSQEDININILESPNDCKINITITPSNYYTNDQNQYQPWLISDNLDYQKDLKLIFNRNTNQLTISIKSFTQKDRQNKGKEYFINNINSTSYQKCIQLPMNCKFNDKGIKVWFNAQAKELIQIVILKIIDEVENEINNGMIEKVTIV